MKRSMMLLAASLLAMACDKPAEQKPDDPASKNATTTSAQPVQTAAPPPVTIADGDLATPADFEEAAEKSITKASYKTELASLETELGKE
jgi:hypothetical protein